jgi:ribosome silencing factor RsfS/YbeB/iojap
VTDPALVPEVPNPDGLPKRRSRGGAMASADDRPPLEIARRVVDYFVIASGGSERQIDAIADGIVGGLRDEKIRPIGREGAPESHWILLDFGAVIVHIFTPPERDFYQLEKHWGEAKTILRVQ